MVVSVLFQMDADGGFNLELIINDKQDLKNVIKIIEFKLLSGAS